MWALGTMLGWMMIALPNIGNGHGACELQESVPAASLGIQKLPPPLFEVHSHNLGKCLGLGNSVDRPPELLVILVFGGVLSQVMVLILVKIKCERIYL